MNRFAVTVLACGVWFAADVAHPQSSSPSVEPGNELAARAIITEALSSVGGSAVAGVKDFTGSGDITFYWAGKEVTGTAQVKARGTEQFRMDVNIPGGTRSWAVSHGTGALKDTGGKLSTIPPHNAIALGSLTFPYLQLIAVSNDKATRAEDLGDVAVQGRTFHKLFLHRDVNSKMGADNPVNHLLDAEYFFDPDTHLLSSVQNETHPVPTMTRNVLHEVQFSDYRSINGVMVPFLITERLGGQRTWTLQLSSIEFNTGLSESDFQF